MLGRVKLSMTVMEGNMKRIWLVSCALAMACTEPVTPEVTPPLESIPFELLGTGRIAFQRTSPERGQVYVIDAATRTSWSAFTGLTSGPAISPDGRQLAVTRLSNSDKTFWDVYVADSAGAGMRQLSSLSWNEGPPSWKPDGSTLFFLHAISEADVTRVVTEARASDGVALRTFHLDQPDACGTYHPSTYESIDVSADGRMVTLCQSDRFVILSASGVRIGSYASPTGSRVDAPTWSPDGTRIAFLESDFKQSGPTKFALRVVDSDGSSVRTVMTRTLNIVEHRWYVGDEDASLCWLKGTNRLLFSMPADPATIDNHLWVVGEDGSGLTQVTTRADVSDRSVSCSRV